jgi:hypothetical protein
MPTYLCHGFRWQRRSVRTYVILQNLDDASPDWIIPAKTSQYILQSFYDIFEFLPYCNPKQGRYSPSREVESDDDTRANPKDRSQSRGRGRSGSQSTTSQSRSQSRAGQQLLPPLPVATGDESSSTTFEDDFSAQDWSAIKLLEEYDPHDLTAVSRPYAYVADYAVPIDLSCSIADEIARYEEQQLQSPNPAIGIPSRDSPAPSPGWFEELRDQLQKGEGLRWYVVVNNDEVREWPNQPSQPSIPRPEPGYQPYQGKPYKQQQPYQYHHQYQPQPGRAIPTLEQRHHHAQYLHQQRIFEGADQEKEQGHQQQQSLDRNGQDQKREQQHQQQQQQQSPPPPPPPLQPQPLIFDKSEQQKKLEEEKRRQKLLFERSEQQRKHEAAKQQQRLLFEQSEQQRKREQQQQHQQSLARKEQELRVERERQRQQREMEQERGKEKEKERERERQREWDRRLEEERERRQRAQNAARLNGAVDATVNRDSKPPMVPAKDYNFPLPPTAAAHGSGNGNGNANASVPRLRPKMSLDAGFGRPKTPGGKGGGLRRLFGRGKVSVDGPYSP